MLTPEEISSRKFLNALRGYDRDEVSEFLNEVADDYRALLERVEKAEAREEQRVAQDGEFDPRQAIGELGEETKRILLAAEEAAEDKRTRAEEDAQAELEQARKTAAEELETARTTAAEELDAARGKSQQMVAEAERHRDEIVASVTDLIEARDQFAGDLAGAIDHIRDVLERVRDLEAPDADLTAGEEDTTTDQPDTESASEAAPEAATSAVDVDAPSAVSDEREREEARGGADDSTEVDVVQRRRAALDDIRPEMVKELKTAIEDTEQGLLERLRQAEDAESTLTPTDEEAEKLTRIGRTYLTTAYEAGLDSGVVLADLDRAGVEADDTRVEAGAEELRDAIAEEMRTTLRATLREGAEQGESTSQLSRRVKKAVKRLRKAVAEAAASASLLRLYELGVHDAWVSGGVAARSWRAAEEAECPDDVCAANADDGVVALDAVFASGDVAPPAHPGCICSLAPA